MSEIPISVSGGADPFVETMNISFARFQELPKALRLKIWKLALPGPRLIDIFSDAPPLINSHRSTPSILHVCSESRKEALEWYTALPLWRPFRAVYVNFQIDTLYFTFTDPEAWAPVWSWPGHRLKDNVRFVSMTQKAWGCPLLAIWFIQRFGKLEELTIVMLDVGTGEITDGYKLKIWDEWQIGDEVGLAIRTSEIPIFNIQREYLEWIKGAVMQKQCGGLKNIKVRLATVQRAGPEEAIVTEL